MENKSENAYTLVSKNKVTDADLMGNNMPTDMLH